MSRLISYADRKAGGPSYFCRRTEYPSVARPGTVPAVVLCGSAVACRSEEHTSELQSLMRISYAVFCLKTKNNKTLQQRVLTVLCLKQHLAGLVDRKNILLNSSQSY